MEYKDIYDELRTVLMGDEFAGTKNEDEIGIGFGHLTNLYDPFHNGRGKIDLDTHKRAIKICKKFADKLYLETKDEYVVKLLEELCIFTGECWINGDMEEIFGTDLDPEYMFDSYKKEEAIEPAPEDKYRLIARYIRRDGSVDEEIRNYKFYLEAKREFDHCANNIKDFLKDSICDKDDEKFKKLIEESKIIDEEMHFKTNTEEFILEKRED